MKKLDTIAGDLFAHTSRLSKICSILLITLMLTASVQEAETAQALADPPPTDPLGAERLYIYFFPIVCPGATTACDYTIPNTMKTLDGSKVGAGQTVCVDAGRRGQLDLHGLRGEPGNPITIINAGGQVIIDTSAPVAFHLRHSEHVRITGTGATAPYGFRIASAGWIGVRLSESDYVELDHVHVDGVPGIGILSKSIASDQHDTSIHDCKLNDVGREGIYVGDSYYYENQRGCYGVEIHNCTLERIAWDGIQVCGAPSGVNVHHNVVRDAGHAPLGGGGNSGSGLIVDSYSSGRWHSNWVENAYRGIYVHSTVLSGPEIFNNIVIQPTTDSVTMFGGEGTEIYNNTIIEPNGVGVHTNHWMRSMSGNIHDNIVAGAHTAFVGPLQQHHNWIGTVANAKFVGRGDYHLTALSPAINVGSADAAPTDYDGVDRDQAPDLGAFEYVSPPLAEQR